MTRYDFRYLSRMGQAVDFAAVGSDGSRFRLRMHEDAVGGSTPPSVTMSAGAERIPDDVVEAFNVWRCRQHAQSVRRIMANPEIYGAADEAALLHQPVPAVGLYHDPVHGWMRNDACLEVMDEDAALIVSSTDETPALPAP